MQNPSTITEPPIFVTRHKSVPFKSDQGSFDLLTIRATKFPVSGTNYLGPAPEGPITTISFEVSALFVGNGVGEKRSISIPLSKVDVEGAIGRINRLITFNDQRSNPTLGDELSTELAKSVVIGIRSDSSHEHHFFAIVSHGAESARLALGDFEQLLRLKRALDASFFVDQEVD
jgi:hypothetical protein